MLRLSRLTVLCSLAITLIRTPLAQVSDPVVSAQAPIPGSDHHYIGIGSETVNPADGSLSFDLPLPLPTGRALSMPFGISYISTDQFHPYANGLFSGSSFVVAWQANPPQPSYQSPLEQGGWSPAGGPVSLTGGKDGHSDSGVVSLNVGGFPVSYSFGSGASATSIASALAGQLNAAASPVTATLSGTTMTLTAKVAGSASNYSLSGSTTWNTQYFSTPSFTISDSGSALTGGSDMSLGAALVTLYAYDGLNNLTCAVQKGSDTTAFTTCSAASATWRPRSFVYDSLSRLTSATNPETGTLSYSYDANGNVSTKASPQVGATSGTGVTTVSYTYDNGNRLTKKTYTNPVSPTVQFGYDGTAISGCAVAPPSISSPTNRVGRRSAMCSAASASSWSYDPMGRVLGELRKNVGSATKSLSVSYLYNADGSMQHIFYPSGRTVNYTVGGAGRVTQVDDTYNIFIASATYTPAGAFATGAKGATNITNVYNNRQQPILLSAATASGASMFSLCYDFHLGQPINAPPCQFSAYTSGNNGNVFQTVDNTSADATNHSVFQYDALNRISQANSAATSGTNCWGEVYTIDTWGNLTNKSGPSGMGGCYTLTMSNPANVQNHLTGLSYDIAGNALNDPLGNALTYDAESRIVSDAGYTYSNDADGLRMEKANGSVGTMYWPGPNGVVAETGLTGTINEEYIYFNGERIARVDRPSGTVHYYYSDHLGATRLITDASANVTERYFYDPYGSVLFPSGSDPNRYEFTGKERDSESSLDMFGARYYGSSLGRFMTPDWSSAATAVPYADFGNPQSLNLYSYTKNNPTTLTDPNGHCDIDGEHHNWVWCAAHVLGLTATIHEQAEYERGYYGKYGLQLYVNGQFVDINKLSDQEVVQVRDAMKRQTEEDLWAAVTGVTGSKPVNLPGWKDIAIDMDHIDSGHTAEGNRAIQSGQKDLFPSGWTREQREAAIREAYRNSSRAGASQGERVFLEGQGGGLTIQMWVNKATNTIESAWPK